MGCCSKINWRIQYCQTSIWLRTPITNEWAAPTAAQWSCRHPTNTLPIVSAACSRLCKHPPPRRSVQAIFRSRAGSDFMCNVRLSLPLSGGWTSPAATQTEVERWRMDSMQGLEGRDGQTHCLLDLLSFQLGIYSLESCTTAAWCVIYIILLQEQSIVKKKKYILFLWTERIRGRQIHGFFFIFQHTQNRRQFPAATWIDVRAFGP